MNSQNVRQQAEITRNLLDTDGLKASLKTAARESVLDHARVGEPIVIWRDQQIITEDAQAASTAGMIPFKPRFVETDA